MYGVANASAHNPSDPASIPRLARRPSARAIDGFSMVVVTTIGAFPFAARSGSSSL